MDGMHICATLDENKSEVIRGMLGMLKVCTVDHALENDVNGRSTLIRNTIHSPLLRLMWYSSVFSPVKYELISR